MANRRGAHSRSEVPQQHQGYGSAQGGQQGDNREAYEQAYQRYVQDQEGARRATGRQGGYQQARTQADGQWVAPSQQTSAYTPVKQAARYGQSGQYGDGQNWNAVPKKSGHPVRNALIVILVLVIAVGGFGGFTAYTLLNSANVVKSDASAVMADISDLKDQILSENMQQANATASDIAKRAKNMKAETEGWSWSVGSMVPEYGGDIVKVRELAGVFDELSKDAIVPLVGEVSQVSLNNLLTDGAINVELAQNLVQALNDAAPVINKAATKLNTMGDAKLDQVNRPLAKARDSLNSLNEITQFVAGIAPTFSDMLGANGEPRTYLVVAQNNSEIRSTGGFLGSIGPLYLDNGRIEMGDFRTIYDIYPADLDNMYAPLTDEEVDIFGTHVSFQIADSNFIPDFSRVAEIVTYAWENKGYGGVDGVIGVDPVFLQDMLALTGSVTASNGMVIDGSNAARILLHDAYYLPAEQTDPLFEEVAALSFGHIMTHLGDMQLTEFADRLSAEMDARRLQIWMANPSEEAAIESLGADGKLSHDATEPTLGVFFTEESYSKLFWYHKADVTVGEAVKNADGTTTYPVSVTYWNMIQNESELSDYMESHNGYARSYAEMITWVMLSAPEGGYISDMECTVGEFMPEGTKWRDYASYISGTMTETTYQGLDFWYGLSRTLPGGTFQLMFNVTTSADATEPLKVVRTPNAQEVAGW